MNPEKKFTITHNDFILYATQSGVRIIHKDSGARGESRTERSQLHNKRLAFERLVESKEFQLWLKKKTFEYTNGKLTVESIVNKMLSPTYLKLEIKDENNHWKEVDYDSIERE